MDDCTYASICLGKQHLQVFVFLLRDVDGVRVQLLEHSVHALPHNPVYRERIYVGGVELFENRVLDLYPLAQLETLGLCFCGAAGSNKHRCSGKEYGNVMFHMRFEICDVRHRIYNATKIRIFLYLCSGF